MGPLISWAHWGVYFTRKNNIIFITIIITEKTTITVIPYILLLLVPTTDTCKIHLRPRWAPSFGLGKICCSVPTQKSFLPSDIVPEFNRVLSHQHWILPPMLSAPRSISNEMPIDQSGKSLLEKAASCHAAAAKIFPPFSSAKARRVKFALRPPPGALYPHPSPNPKFRKSV